MYKTIAKVEGIELKVQTDTKEGKPFYFIEWNGQTKVETSDYDINKILKYILLTKYQIQRTLKRNYGLEDWKRIIIGKINKYDDLLDQIIDRQILNDKD